jgi:homoserine O-succinyltransferase
MTLVLAHTERCVRIGLVNNMPDSALAGTERQFLNLLGNAAPDVPVQMSFFSLPGIPRLKPGRAHLESNFYRSSWDLHEAQLDALIVTGTEPRLPDLRDEPYWGDMTDMFDWLEREGPPVAFSCLAAHAAVLHFDFIERRRLPEKRFGMFSHVKVDWNELTDRLGPTVRVAHSRWNEIPVEALERRGYRILTQSPEAGADFFIKSRRNTWLFFQGHPEYDPGALGREYQRDVKRFLARERETYPALPKNYFANSETELLTAFRTRAIADRVETAMEEFPVATCQRSAADGWQSPASSVFRTWLQQIADAKYGVSTSTPAQYRDKAQPALALSRS